MRTPHRLTLLSTSLVLLLAGLGAPAAALVPSTPSQAAWVAVRYPGRGAYAPTPADSGNTTGGINNVKRLGVGRWQVRFPGIGPNAVPQVVSLATNARRCQITGFGRNPHKRYAWTNVACFRPDNAPVDTRFVVTTVRRGTSGDAARQLMLAYADQPAAGAPYTPTVRWNSTGGTVEVERLGLGSYLVTFGVPGGGDLKSIAVATAVSSALQPRACQVVGWTPTATEEQVSVHCQNGTGVAEDSAFTLQYAVRAGLEGLLHGPNASFWSDVITSPDPWIPDADYDWSSAGKASKVEHVSTGVYRATLKGMPPAGAVIVNAFTDGLTCQPASIRRSGKPQQIEVRCFIFDGTIADGQFELAFTK